MASPRPCPALPQLVAANPIELRPRGDFVDWLSGSGGTLAVTTYNSGKLAFFSAKDGRLGASYWRFPRPMGLAVHSGRLAVASRDHICLLRVRGTSSAADAADLLEAFDLETTFATGRLDIHDLAFDRRGLLLANTRFNCVVRPSERLSFLRHWQPWFVPNVVRKDCCHLNGLGMRAGRLAMVTAFCESEAPGAWREGNRFQSGVLIDVRAGRVAARGLCMPHSPRWHAGRWWLCDSGHGRLSTFDPADGTCEPVADLPGFTRGLTFAVGRAIVGLSRIRKRHILDAPPVRERWTALRAGVALVDPARGVETGSLEFVRGGREVYDVAFLPAGFREP